MRRAYPVWASVLAAAGLWLGACGEIAERHHTSFDPELGWVHVPGLQLPDFYGPGLDLTVNGQGFRGTRDTPRQAPPGRARVVCSGDSFTLGYGVGDADTWCARLEALDLSLETVNMGQGGYGLGQAYLWYLRDGLPLHADAQVFAFIAADFARMGAPRFQGHAKPVVAWRGGALVVDGVPVPERPRWARWLLGRWDVLRERFAGPDPDAGEAIRRVAGAVFDELARLHRERGSGLLLVYLPMRGEHRRALEPRLNRFVADRARELGVGFVDLGEALRRLPAASAGELFLADDAIDFPGAAGHMSAIGNAWVARELVGRIRELPAVARRLE